MKKNFRFILIVLISLVFILRIGTVRSVKAYEENDILIDIDVEGGEDNEFKAGDNVTVKIKINEVSNLYAASFMYTYDNTLLQVDSVDVNDEIQSAGVYEPYKDTAKDGNKARYCFTLLEDNPGLSGTYDFVTINGKVIRDGEINVGADNIIFQLIRRDGEEMVKDDYRFQDSKGNIYKVTNVTEEGTNSNGDLETNKNSNSQVKVELVEKAEDREEEFPQEEEKDVDTEENEISQAPISSVDKEESKENDDLKEEEAHKSNIIFKILGAAVIVGAIIVLIVVYSKKK